MNDLNVDKCHTLILVSNITYSCNWLPSKTNLTLELELDTHVIQVTYRIKSSKSNGWYHKKGIYKVF